MAYSVHTAVIPLSEIHLTKSNVAKPEDLLNIFWGRLKEKKRKKGGYSASFHLLFIQVQQELIPCRVNSV